MGALLLGLLIWAGAYAYAGPPQAGKNTLPLKPWTIDYWTSGGIVGLSYHLSVRDDGDVTVVNRHPWLSQTRFAATRAEMEAIGEALAQLHLSGVPPAVQEPPPLPDAIVRTVEVTLDGQKYTLGKSGRALVAVIDPILRRGLDRAADERWVAAGPFRVGRVWHLRIEVRDAQGLWNGEDWNGVLTTRKDGKSFDAVWSNSRTGAEVRETAELLAAGRGAVELTCGFLNQRLEGVYSPDHPDEITGKLWTSPHWNWWARIEYR